VTLTWTLIELVRQPELQERLRAEILAAFPGRDPTADELASPSVLPYLDAVVHETLRLHPAVTEAPRKVRAAGAAWRSVHPLTARAGDQGRRAPARDAGRAPGRGPPPARGGGPRPGPPTDRIPIAKGTFVAVPIAAINRLESVWGPDAHAYNPERWLDGGARIPAAAKELPGHRHMLTFLDGPKT
jgi:cytochrome P450